jgi:hypothetical protein
MPPVFAEWPETQLDRMPLAFPRVANDKPYAHLLPNSSSDERTNGELAQ